MIIYTALGDSITAGENASSLQNSYPFLIEATLQKRTKSAILNVLAEPSWTSKALVTNVMQNSSGPLCTATTISIYVGGNDLIDAGMAVLQGAPRSTVQQSIQQYGRDLARLIRIIRTCTASRIVLCTQYNPFPASPIAAEAINALNAVTEMAAQQANIELAPVHAWFAGHQAEWIAGYRNGRIEDVLNSRLIPIHPNNAGHRAIAQGLLRYIR
jgi:acyl-CoA thioesterase-1